MGGGDPIERARRTAHMRKAVRHDLRNLLTIILGRCELLESGALGGMPPAQVEGLRAIVRSAERMAVALDVLAHDMDALLGVGGDGRREPPEDLTEG